MLDDTILGFTGQYHICHGLKCLIGHLMNGMNIILCHSFYGIPHGIGNSFDVFSIDQGECRKGMTEAIRSDRFEQDRFTCLVDSFDQPLQMLAVGIWIDRSAGGQYK